MSQPQQDKEGQRDAEEAQSQQDKEGQSDADADGDGEGEEARPLRKKSAVRALLQDFSPIWFTYCMNAGIIAILLHQLPYQFQGLSIISTIAFLIELALFICFSIIFAGRLLLFGKTAYHEITNDITELSLLSCWPISWLILSSLVSLIVSAAAWGGHAFTIVAYVMWWFGAGWMLITYFFVLVTMTRRQNTAPDAGGRLPPLVLLPAMGIATIATTGGLIANHSSGISARMAVPIIIFCFLMIGLSTFTTTLLYTLMVHNLFSTGWPEPSKTPALFILAGPLAQSAAALQLLGSSASTYKHFAGYNKGIFLTAAAAQPLDVACVLIALLMAGMSAMLLLLAAYAMVERACQKQLSWSMPWNGIIFPIGTFATVCLQFSIEMNSPTWRTLDTALVVLMVILYVVNVVFAAWKTIKGELLIDRENLRAQKVD